MEHQQIIKSINKDLSTTWATDMPLDEFLNLLAAHVNLLVRIDFERLIRLLYRIDVNEAKLKQLLKENTQQDAGKIIASMIIERQLQKIKSRQQYNQRDTNLSEEELL